MSFWKKSGYHYLKVVEITEEQLILLINSMTREDIQEWLIWNDPNGIYSDELSLKEIGNIMSRDEAIEILLRQAEQNRL